MGEENKDTSAEVQDSKSHQNPVSKVIDAVKKPFSHEKAKDNPPALQEAIDKMEARRDATIEQMRAEGKDPSVLSGKRVDQVRNVLPSEGFSGLPT